MLEEKINNLKKQINRKEVTLKITDERILSVLKGLIELRLNKITFIETVKEKGETIWVIRFSCNELEYEKFCEQFKNYEIYSVEQDRFGKIYYKRLEA